MKELLIDNDILKGCKEKNLRYVSIPDGVRAIGDAAFKDMTSLQFIEFPKTLTYIGDAAFENCSTLSECDLSRIKYMGERIFLNCTSLKKVQFGDSLPFLCNASFAGRSALEEIHLPASVTYIGCECFKDCTALTDIELPGVMEIDQNAFENRSI